MWRPRSLTDDGGGRAKLKIDQNCRYELKIIVVGDKIPLMMIYRYEYVHMYNYKKITVKLVRSQESLLDI